MQMFTAGRVSSTQIERATLNSIIEITNPSADLVRWLIDNMKRGEVIRLNHDGREFMGLIEVFKSGHKLLNLNLRLLHSSDKFLRLNDFKIIETESELDKRDLLFTCESLLREVFITQEFKHCFCSLGQVEHIKWALNRSNNIHGLEIYPLKVNSLGRLIFAYLYKGNHQISEISIYVKEEDTNTLISDTIKCTNAFRDMVNQIKRNDSLYFYTDLDTLNTELNKRLFPDLEVHVQKVGYIGFLYKFYIDYKKHTPNGSVGVCTVITIYDTFNKPEGV